MFTYILESTAERRTRRDNDIKTLFQQLTIRENMSFMEAYEAVGYVFYLSDQEMEQALIKEIGNKAGKESVKSRLCRTKGGKPCNASERTK